MRMTGIGDLFIPAKYIEEGTKVFRENGAEVRTVDWQLRDFDELQHINLLVEQGGREEYQVPENILEAVRDADILFTQFCPVNAQVLEAAEKLKYIGVMRAGYENVNVELAKRKGIKVFNCPGRNAHSVSDFAVGLMICEARNIARGHFGIKNGEWIRTYPNSESIPDFNGRTVGIIGYGEIGHLVARKLSGFDVEILVYDPYYKGNDVKSVSLEQLMEQSDFVTLHARLTPETEHMIGEREFRLMKPTAYFINTSRSALVDEHALYDALKEKRIAGAAIDVFDVEPPDINYPLVTLPNVTLTPHMAGGSQDAFRNTPKRLSEEMIRFILGKEEDSRFLIR